MDICKGSMTGKFIETESRVEVTRGCREGDGESQFDGDHVSVWNDGNILDMDSDVGCITL